MFQNFSSQRILKTLNSNLINKLCILVWFDSFSLKIQGFSCKKYFNFSLFLSVVLQTCCGFRCDCPRDLQSEDSQGTEQGAKAALVFSCCERLSRALCSLPVSSVEKPAKQKSEVLGCNSQTIFKRVMLYCIFPFIYKACLAFICAAVPAIHLVQNRALLYEERSPLKSEQSQREVTKMHLFVPLQIVPWTER